jgi:hypothetical protein
MEFNTMVIEWFALSGHSVRFYESDMLAAVVLQPHNEIREESTIVAEQPDSSFTRSVPEQKYPPRGQDPFAVLRLEVRFYVVHKFPLALV